MPDKFLKSAGQVVTFLLALAGLVYLLGGLVIGLRLLFEGFDLGTVVTIIGQLPRQLVVTTALLEVALPAAVVGLIAVMVTGVWPVWCLLDSIWGRVWSVLQKIGHWLACLLRKSERLHKLGHRIRGKASAFGAWLGPRIEPVALLVLAGILIAPAWLHAKSGGSKWGVAVGGVALTYVIALLCLPRRRWFDPRQKSYSEFVRAASVFAIFAVIALTPSLLLASTQKFPEAQACTTGAVESIEGRLVGEGGGQVLLEQTAAHEQWVFSLPASQVTKSEYGDIAAKYVCQEPSEEEKLAVLEAEQKAEEEVGGHGGPTEQKLATLVRPDLYFDSEEHWRPISPSAFINESFGGIRHQVCTKTKGKPGCEDLVSLKQLDPKAPTPTWIDVVGSADNGVDFRSPNDNCQIKEARDCNGGKGAVIYYRRSAHEGLWYWDFWWFYRYNDYNGNFNRCTFYCDDHEGDWEGMVVVTTESLEPQITGAIYAAHRDRIYVPAATLPTSEGHPIAYVAKGTHATYPYACPGKCHQYVGLYEERFPEEHHDGKIPWAENVDPACAAYHCVRPLPVSPDANQQKLPYAGGWAAWPGKWGASCDPGCGQPDAGNNISPSSPGFQSRFLCPWVSNLTAVPEGDEGLLTGERRFGGWERERDACLAERAHG